MNGIRLIRASGLAFLIAATLGLATLGLTGGASAQSFVDAVAKACAKEVKTYCSKVTQGQGRVALCLLAFEDKLSRGCDDTLFYAASELGKMMVARAEVVKLCEPDARRLCPGMKVGDGNVLACLNLAQKALSRNCNQAIVDAQLR